MQLNSVKGLKREKGRNKQSCKKKNQWRETACLADQKDAKSLNYRIPKKSAKLDAHAGCTCLGFASH